MNTETTKAKPMTKKAQAEADKQQALTFLREVEGVREGTRVYTMITSRSSSGMSRNVRVFIAKIEDGEEVEARIVEITHMVARGLGMSAAGQGDIRVGGCGFDAGHHVVMNLSYALFGKEKGHALKHERM